MTSSGGTKMNSAAGSINREINHGHATRSIFGRSRVIQRIGCFVIDVTNSYEHVKNNLRSLVFPLGVLADSRSGRRRGPKVVTTGVSFDRPLVTSVRPLSVRPMLMARRV